MCEKGNRHIDVLPRLDMVAFWRLVTVLALDRGQHISEPSLVGTRPRAIRTADFCYRKLSCTVEGHETSGKSFHYQPSRPIYFLPPERSGLNEVYPPIDVPLFLG